MNKYIKIILTKKQIPTNKNAGTTTIHYTSHTPWQTRNPHSSTLQIPLTQLTSTIEFPSDFQQHQSSPIPDNCARSILALPAHSCNRPEATKRTSINSSSHAIPRHCAVEKKLETPRAPTLSRREVHIPFLKEKQVLYPGMV